MHQSPRTTAVEQLASEVGIRAREHAATSKVWFLRPERGNDMEPVVWVTVRPEATAEAIGRLVATMRDVQRRRQNSGRLPVILLLDQGDGQLTPLGSADPLGRPGRSVA
jgi:hypothetical protein